MNLRQPLAAVLGVGGLVIGAIAAISTPASAADGDLVAPATFTCVTDIAPTNPQTWNAQFTLSAVRPEGSDVVTVIVTSNKMANGAPVAMNNLPITNTMVLDAGGTTVNLSGSGHVTAAGGEAFDVPELRGTFTSDADSVALTAKSYGFVVEYGSVPTLFTTECTPTPATGVALGTVTFVEGEVPTQTPSPTPTTTTSATATPTASASTTADSGSGKPAKGKAVFACELNIGSEFDWEPTVTVSGYRVDESDPVSLVATMTDLPGIAPVPIIGPMDFTLDVKVGGKKTTLKSSADVNAQPKAAVPVADLTGEVDVDGDELDVAVTAFTFDFPSGGVGAECTASSGSLGVMVVGTEAVEADDSGGDSGGGTTSGGGTLPQTGGGDAMPVVALWALALTLLGAALLLCVPEVARRKS